MSFIRPCSVISCSLDKCLIDRILTISRGFRGRITGDAETTSNLASNGGGPIKIGAF